MISRIQSLFIYREFKKWDKLFFWPGTGFFPVRRLFYDLEGLIICLVRAGESFDGPHEGDSMRPFLLLHGKKVVLIDTIFHDDWFAGIFRMFQSGEAVSKLMPPYR